MKLKKKSNLQQPNVVLRLSPVLCRELSKALQLPLLYTELSVDSFSA